MDEIDPSTQALLDRYAFDKACFEQLRRALRDPTRSNRVKGALQAPEDDDVFTLPPAQSVEHARLAQRGLAELASGHVAVVILSGGMATRFGGVVKANVEVLPGRSFLALKLRDVVQRARDAARPLDVALMVSHATEHEVAGSLPGYACAELTLCSFAQSISLRVTPEAALFRDAVGRLSPYAPGHGDLPSALRRTGVLAALRARGVRHLFVSNVDNLGATLEPAVIGAHVASGRPLSFEVVALAPGDQGGVPARLEGRLQVIEAVRYPEGFDQSTIPWFSINNLVLDADSLDRDFALDWFRVDKLVDGRNAVQFERFVNQLTAFLPSRALAVERAQRFLPIKSPYDLAAQLPALRARLGG